MFDQFEMPLKSHPTRDLAGQRFGRLQVLNFAGIKRGRNSHTRRFWFCQCDCGNQLPVRMDQLVRGITQSCGCLQRETAAQLKFNPELSERRRQRELVKTERRANGHPIVANFKDLTGQKFWRLTVQQFAGVVSQQGRWLCICDCGNLTIVRSVKLLQKNKSTRSCGCLLDETRSKTGLSHKRHGHASNGRRSVEYKSWCAMKYRCLNKDSDKYADYGGRGITVCDRWLKSFEAFLADMGPRPRGTSLHRIDNDGNYEPGNCIWATAKVQASNRRSRKRA